MRFAPLLQSALPALAAFVFFVSSPAVSGQQSASGEMPVSYVVDLRSPATHLAGVTMTIPAAEAGTEIQFPTWNAVYLIRDFVRNVLDVRSQCDGNPGNLLRVDINTWSTGQKNCGTLKVNYAVYLTEESVFSGNLDERHAFLNLAMALFYLPQERQRPVRIRYDYPQGWKLATLIEGLDEQGWYTAKDYDELVDSPVEASAFQEYAYTQGGADYRIVVHADPKAYDSQRLLETVKKITAAATGLMNDIPFSRYTFIYHFPRDPGGGGGMEHADGTAITIASTVTLKVPPSYPGGPVALLTDVEQLRVRPDQVAKVVIDEQSGVIVMGENVRISTVAIAQGNLTIHITESKQVSQPNAFSTTGTTTTVDRTSINIDEGKDRKLAVLPTGVSLQSLVNGLNALGVGPRDMITILQTIKAAGALQADIEVM